MKSQTSPPLGGSFTFVERIVHIEPGRRAGGTYRLPGGRREVPPWLVAEAIGQLAAWTAMAGSDFRRRPVAAIAGEVIITDSSAERGLLELEAEVEPREDSIVYRGAARLDGRFAGELKRCVGPMLAMAEFDDPNAVRRRFEQLRTTGKDAAEFGDPLALLQSTPLDPDCEEARRVRLEVPRAAPFFAEHFPRRPVFPATLLMNFQANLAVDLLAGLSDAPSRLRAVRHIKVRAFTAPGSTLEIEARLRERRDDCALVAVRALAGDRTVATAQVEVGARA